MKLLERSRSRAMPEHHARHSSELAETAGVAPAVRIRDLTKSFGSGETRVQALRGIDLEVLPGAMTLLAGPSGCGKTTLISIIAGLLDPTTGSLEVLGQDLTKMPAGQLVDFRAANLGFVFQQYNLLPSLTAAENACLPLLVAGVPRRKALERARSVLERVGLEPRADAYPSQLSGGQQQRVAIARALVHGPRLLVCDEPTAALDGQAGQTVMELFQEVAVEPNRAVIIVTHDERVLRYGERIVHMTDGKIDRIDTKS
jgi:putative ABC transport system ATP-binding protein